ncbi:hypothetical protein CHH28_01115 [Bacterioplanes sanyensis]|uniref:DUF2092 domain-containing protein n=1 Tax=Bacterioplanes sanyensis TaxID=1249553 RepID=A0A222FE47_9GAMM|nr:hypothetical protein [Bacterioplanes sanyensis]ASP37365.1 hypothetical protein CHH28_01115 [Bacterioplanes sanyensis]
MVRIVFFLLSALPLLANANGPSIQGIRIGQSLNDVIPIITQLCSEAISNQVIAPPTFPLANQQQQQLNCAKSKQNQSITVTVADLRVAHVFVNNISLAELQKTADDGREYLDYLFFDQGGLWFHKHQNSATLISEKGVHPNLFVWQPGKNRRISTEQGMPKAVDFSLSLTQLMPLYKQHCQPLEVLETDSWLDSNPEKQLQINCFNYHYLGFPRKIELIFADNQLALAWILTGEEEEQRVRDQLIHSHGQVRHQNQRWDSFTDKRVYLRKDKPEVLIIAPEHFASFNDEYDISAS